MEYRTGWRSIQHRVPWKSGFDDQKGSPYLPALPSAHILVQVKNFCHRQPTAMLSVHNRAADRVIRRPNFACLINK